MFFYTALVIGILGSFHCAGMCGPIALAVSMGRNSAKSRLLYNAGRITTYSLLGLIFGMLGHTLVIAGFEKNLSILSGAFLLIFAVMTILPQKKNSFNFLIVSFTNSIKQGFKKLFTRKTLWSHYLVGTVNGLLPCGLVYVGLAAASSTGQGSEGFLYMVIFGLGTLPMMLSISIAGNLIGNRYQTLLFRLTPVLTAALAIFLIYRGLSFSPKACCHH